MRSNDDIARTRSAGPPLRTAFKISALTPETAIARTNRDAGKMASVSSEVTTAHALAAVAKNFEAQRAVLELGLLLSTRDSAIENMARLVVNAADNDGFSAEVICFNASSARWYRGELSAERALNEFEADVKSFRSMNLSTAPGDELPDEEAAAARPATT
jgi:hypothetical protein